ncbi:Fip1 motif-domain-containing protein [Cercophora newfieldiana]|uniref:Fip1 motif-domain-containing protein n=1 Tax=Cercophora newfieldiana TaxID=92897 RepID=A0AA40CKP6_9PEZI|nr:Fip1 motif-domain-containing protein [Cercophora newfieldiana]
MDIDEDDDFYAPDEPEVPAAQAATATAPPPTSKPDAGDELEEGEEEDEGGEMDEDEDSDIDIITENKDTPKAAPPSQSRYSEIRNIPQRSTATETTSKSAVPKGQEPRQRAADQPPVSTSKIDVNAIPIHKQTGKPLTQVNIDEDLTDSDKPWRKPGTDLSDYFNYGFDEFTWALYAQKQEAIRGEYSQDAMAQNNKKMMEEFGMMMMGGMVPGMPGAAGAGAGGAGAGAAIAGMEGMTPEALMQQMMASGIDISQMDPSAMAAMYANAGGVGAGSQGSQGQNFGAGFGGNQGQGSYGYDQQMSGGGNSGGGGGGGGRGGRGRGRRW